MWIFYARLKTRLCQLTFEYHLLCIVYTTFDRGTCDGCTFIYEMRCFEWLINALVARDCVCVQTQNSHICPLRCVLFEWRERTTFIICVSALRIHWVDSWFLFVLGMWRLGGLWRLLIWIGLWLLLTHFWMRLKNFGFKIFRKIVIWL